MLRLPSPSARASWSKGWGVPFSDLGFDCCLAGSDGRRTCTGEQVRRTALRCNHVPRSRADPTADPLARVSAGSPGTFFVRSFALIDAQECSSNSAENYMTKPASHSQEAGLVSLNPHTPTD